ncbi:unnamed protein product [Moneuplotes crassus]|uniref:Uncharacterized protein n=1 Tax=Euplotes crassus TaxID=5936 RepID=A0AAD1U7Y5_EUPCR|nr:unnamed protein product [Moneuplotes crassus]
MESYSNTLSSDWVPLGGNEVVENTNEESKLPELDFDAMFAASTPADAGIESNQDGVVDIRYLLGTQGRSTEADCPEVMVIEKKMEEEGDAVLLPLTEEFKDAPTEEDHSKVMVLDARAFFLRKVSAEVLSKDRMNAKEGEKVEFTTCNDVIKEIKDESTRLYVDNLPFKLDCKDPSDAAIKFVSKFSKETGDYKSLSGTDLRVIALAYSIILQRKEAKYCRKSPPTLEEFRPAWMDNKKKTKKQEKLEEVEEEEDDGFKVVEKKKKPKKKKFRRNVKKDFYPEAFLNELSKNKNTNKDNTPNENEEKSNSGNEQVEAREETEIEIPKGSIEEPSATNELTEPATEEDPQNETPTDEKDKDVKIDEDDVLVQKDTVESSESDNQEDDCDDEWITPDNINTYLLSQDDQGHQNDKVEDNSRKVSVEVVTSDFAMQNVLMQIGIPVVSLEGVEIRQIKRFKLRCDGCKQINQRVDVEFCQKCGGHTLRKVSVFANSNGKITFFKGKRLKKNNRGNQFDIPIPKSGRHSQAMILREDQLWRGQNKLKMKEQERLEDKIKNKIGDHFNDLVSFEHKRKEDSRTEGTTTYGFGKKNPNIPQKRYSKKKKH